MFLGDHSKKDLDKGEREIQIEKVYGLEECPTCDFALLILAKDVSTFKWQVCQDLMSHVQQERI